VPLSQCDCVVADGQLAAGMTQVLAVARTSCHAGGRVDKPLNDLGLIATMAQVLVGRKGRLPKIRQGGCAS